MIAFAPRDDGGRRRVFAPILQERDGSPVPAVSLSHGEIPHGERRVVRSGSQGPVRGDDRGETPRPSGGGRGMGPFAEERREGRGRPRRGLAGLTEGRRSRRGPACPASLLLQEFPQPGFPREVRKLVFGKDEKRQLQDMRRSGAVEGGSVEDQSNKMANTVDRNEQLRRAYTR
jgi:hypothetical protein